MKEIRTDFQKLFDESKDEFLADFKQLIRIPSVNGNKTYQAPFGIGPKRALEYMLDLSQRLGFRTGQAGDCVGWAEYGPETEDYFGVLGHIDVVDVVDDWNYPPFDLTLKDGYFYGRGVLDNKGPLLSTLFALYLIKKQQLPLKKRIRIMFGTDEEMGSRDIPYFLKEQQPPYAGFTPDCKFPIVYGERGIVDLTITLPIEDGSLEQIDSIDGVFDHSFLPDYAAITVNGQTSEFHGKKAPSNAPDMAENVLPVLVKNNQYLTGRTGDVFKWLNEKIADQYNGENLGLNYRDEDSGELQLSFYDLEKSVDEISFSISMRYPVTISEEKILSQLKSQLLDGMKIKINRSFPSTVKDKNLPYMQRFSKIYAEDTGLNGEPVTTTGATYAREMPNIIAFGPSFPGQKGIAHKGDEWLKYSDWLMMMQIYYDCLIDEITN
ncbi:Sapep family Mn(2+)-dependent dipeptidase [Companilactobacillus sp. HBUAS56275]|uniref:Sapep family Mn(2+)-dependent dipeptidase n=1 Tax=Candidatus Companilactobacillus pullicola TaxID=2838523 RepID=A0A9D1ZQR4_9LACO|nr:Sapep family Mn(2+)-dependent dipeptidase [Candidatus Companilactobacillus pullicola]